MTPFNDLVNGGRNLVSMPTLDAQLFARTASRGLNFFFRRMRRSRMYAAQRTRSGRRDRWGSRATAIGTRPRGRAVAYRPTVQVNGGGGEPTGQPPRFAAQLCARFCVFLVCRWNVTLLNVPIATRQLGVRNSTLAPSYRDWKAGGGVVWV